MIFTKKSLIAHNWASARSNMTTEMTPPENFLQDWVILRSIILRNYQKNNEKITKNYDHLKKKPHSSQLGFS